MLVDEHSDGYPTHVQAIEEVLNILVGDWIFTEGLLVLDDTLSHGGHHIVVPVPDVHQCGHKAMRQERVNFVTHHFHPS